VVIASAEPYANYLHFTADWQPRHYSVSTSRSYCNHQCQSKHRR